MSLPVENISLQLKFSKYICIYIYVHTYIWMYMYSNKKLFICLRFLPTYFFLYFCFNLFVEDDNEETQHR